MRILFLLLSSLALLTYSANARAELEIKSKDIRDQGKISRDHVYNGNGCTGKKIAPQISWRNAPKNSKSFAVTIYDPDARNGNGWWHWIVVDIPANYRSLPADFGKPVNAILQDEIMQVRNSFNEYKYGGPCPPVGDKPHKYVITVYALKTAHLRLDEDATPEQVGKRLNQNLLEKAELHGTYERTDKKIDNDADGHLND